MTHYIAHRVNSLAELRKLPTRFGVEVDLRDTGDRLIMEHDPFSDGEDFEEYAKEYRHGTMILNIKSERIEHRALKIVQQYDIKEYFLLDSTFPMIYSLSNEGEYNIAARYSEIEPIENALALSKRCKWIWVDCFSILPITKAIESRLRKAGFKLCLVSPELQGRQEDIPTYKSFFQREGISFDAICTKSYNISLWEESCSCFTRFNNNQKSLI